MKESEKENADQVSRVTDKLVELKRNPTKAALILFALWFLLWTFNGISKSYFTFDLVGIFFNGLYLAAIYLCISMGLNMTYKLIGFANFAHAEYFVTGAYVGVAYSLYFAAREATLGDYFLVLILAFLTSGLVALIGDYFIFEPLRKLNSTPEAMMITSIGWGILLRNVLLIFFSGQASYYRVKQVDGFNFFSIFFKEPFVIPSFWIGNRKGVGFLNFAYTQYFLEYERIFAIVISAIVVSALFIFLQRTKLGKALRATSDNIDLAESSGIDTTQMIRITWLIGGGLAGVAGVLFATRTPVIPYTGFIFLLPAFAVVVLGGVGSLKGSVYAAVIVAFTQYLSEFYLNGMQTILEINFAIERNGLNAYSKVFPFVILIGVILFKPQGLFGDE